MSISRRKFIEVGAIAAIFAGVSLKPNLLALGQDLPTKVSKTDPLANYTQATFAQYVNSIFRIRGIRTVDVTLVKVEELLPLKASRAGGRESFALQFRGGGFALLQDTYTVEHAALGTFSLFLVPSGTDDNGAQGYVATFNRLAYAAKPLSVPGKRLDRRAPEATSPGPAEKSPDKPAEAPPTKPSKKGNSDPVSLGEGPISN